ncbi:MAG: Asp-tRNA(Asn)/Glu-tRNA(Gln) amidotransferase subunit GatC [Saprospiraceae bacterium]
MKIDSALISKLEQLARLELSADEKERITGDLNNILTMVSKLEELDTDNVKPLIYISEEVNVLRPDVVKNQVNTADALKNAPNADDQYFRVPKMIKK